ncbi:MAG TPA: GIY-YIG nuclease family protein [Candidatus Angelobacter sp.]|nr:GIY-YIG nuclease family protein [Candidatus Angelobacter sp.]
MQRPTPDTVIQGLTTKSDKIRALNQAGYKRAEIAEILDIRYQHVRKVLLDAGITGGLKHKEEFERPPVTIEVDAKPPKPTPGDALLRAGFEYLGDWIALGDGELKLSAKAPTAAGVYAFLVDDLVVYVGLAQRGFRTRMGHYRRGYERQKTSARIKKLIASELAAGKQVKVLTAKPENSYEWHGLPVNTAAGLEGGLIRVIQPPWNLLGKSREKKAAKAAGTNALTKSTFGEQP